jgi:hypothetical protein
MGARPADARLARHEQTKHAPGLEAGRAETTRSRTMPDSLTPATPGIDHPLAERLRGRYGSRGTSGPLPSMIMLEAADRIEDMERELAMIKADRDHLLACADRARAGRADDASELEASIRSANFHGEQYARICRERDDALQHAKQESEAHAHTRQERDTAERLYHEGRIELTATKAEIDRSTVLGRNERDAVVRLVGERDQAREAAESLRAALAKAAKRADEMEGKAGEWIALDIHRQRVAAAVAGRQRDLDELRAEVERLQHWPAVAGSFRKDRAAAVAEMEMATEQRNSLARLLRRVQSYGATYGPFPPEVEPLFVDIDFALLVVNGDPQRNAAALAAVRSELGKAEPS